MLSWIWKKVGHICFAPALYQQRYDSVYLWYKQTQMTLFSSDTVCLSSGCHTVQFPGGEAPDLFGQWSFLVWNAKGDDQRNWTPQVLSWGGERRHNGAFSSGHAPMSVTADLGADLKLKYCIAYMFCFDISLFSPHPPQ